MVCSLSLFDADEDSLYLVLGTGLYCCVPDRVIEKRNILAFYITVNGIRLLTVFFILEVI